MRNIKSAYKCVGYVVSAQDEDVMIYTGTWFVKCRRDMLPRKALAAIVEHMGMIPEAPVSIEKDGDPQLVMEEVAAGDMDHWRGGARARC